MQTPGIYTQHNKNVGCMPMILMNVYFTLAFFLYTKREFDF